MIADRHDARGFWLAALVLAGVLAPRPAHQPERTTAVRHEDPYSVVPLLGDPVADSGQCVPFLKQILAMPHWQLQIAHGASGCLGDTLFDSFRLDNSSGVVWTSPGMPDRLLSLEPDELATIESIDRLDCTRKEEVGYGEAWFRISVGSDPSGEGGAYIPGSSDAGIALKAIFDAEIDRSVHIYLAALGRVDLRLTVHDDLGSFHVRLLDRQLTITWRGKQVYAGELEDRELADLIARLLEQQHEAGGDATGYLYLPGRRVSITTSSSWHVPDRDPLAHAIDEARYAARPPESNSADN